ncbi:Radical SAM domain protein [Denitrovibrio acetiphilus DSM 12809]|uniref:Radical SAM domain protein n=1 Tax=Denitrovibrio acetiphilus (strain DSM 12809 / NBRC 114555 / N2460) TaxID=522772 RepID=D4H135_DENA2|nr:radical SAM protein [Denitrovibrio acetiphilus]ADD68698.1 Radical SAM domain protein [Denitrovibrio acetiphilus DSM 12809]
MPRYTEPLYRPPSEANSLIFQITEGCSYNKCAFCGMYTAKPFRVKPVADVIREVDDIPEEFAMKVHKVFLADGDAAVYPTEGLIKILEHMNMRFPEIRRYSSYCGPQAIMKKSMDEWKSLYDAGLQLLYFGLESGNREVLKLMNKGMDAFKVMPKIKQIKELGVQFSVMIILGGGGKKLKQAHIDDSAKWISEVNPDFLSFLTLFLRRKKDYFNNLEKPTMADILDETRGIIEKVDGRNIIFRSNHVSNFVPLSGRLSQDKSKLISQIEDTRKVMEHRGILNEYPDFYEEF